LVLLRELKYVAIFMLSWQRWLCFNLSF